MENILSFLCNQARLKWAFSCIFGDGNYIHMMEANLEALKNTMKKLQELRVDIDRKVTIEEDKGLQRLAQVQGWCSRVEHIQSEVNDLLDAESTETGRLCLFRYCSNDCISSCEYDKKVWKTLEEVKRLLSEGVFEVVADKTPVPKVEKKHIQTTVGLDSMVEKAWNKLVNGEHTKTLGDENVKSCFLYCSLFPEDYEISKEQLIEYWICEGFIIGDRDEDGSNNQGHDIIGSLVRAHLLIDLDGEFPRRVKMHDVVREMALWIGSNLGEGKKNWVKSGAQLRCVPKDIKWEVVRRMSLMSNQIEEISCCPPQCTNLSTLILRNNDLKSISDEFFQFMPALVILDLSENKNLHYLREEISSLTSLQYLNLSNTAINLLPMKGLRKLISLDLERTWYLKSIDGIGTSLPNLQVLKLYNSSVCIDARSMEELQLLEHLKIFTGKVKDALILERIQGMERLASCVQRLCISYMSAQVVTLNMVALGGLRKLEIWNSKISEIKIDWGSKEKEELICPTSPCFKRLSTVFIYSLEGPKDLTWLLLVPNLRNITVFGSESIEEIINREKGMSISNVHPDIDVPFQKLEILRLSKFPGLKRICSNPLSLPKLRKFHVNNCPNLPKAATEFTSASI